ncbi:MAG TPA: acetyl-CoA C-acetyltransferase, partial [Methylococcaceae bacterium]|nr:acetyl-CoA C-acetyltransferase [Methylococcaceae bacterium]
MNNAETVVITGSARTPIGDFTGCLSPCSATQLGAVAIKGALRRCDINPHQIDEVLMGCVLTA